MKYFIQILICLISGYSMAQMPNWKAIPIDLPSGITNLETDSLGFIWISSTANLYRFNGAELELKFEFADENIISLTKKEGIFYLGTEAGRILSANPYNTKSRVIYESTDKIPVTDLHIIDEYNFATLSYGLGVQLIINGKSNHISADKGLLSNEVYEIVEYNGEIYISTDQGLQIITIENNDFRLSQITEQDGLSDLVTTQLLVSGDKLWYSDYDSHIGYLDKNRNIKNYPIKLKGKIRDIISHKELIYVLNDEGIQSFDNEKWIFTYKGDASIKGKLLQIDEEDNLWIIDTKNNLSLGNLRFQKIDLEIDDIRAITKIDDKLYIGNESGLFVYSNDITKEINSKNITYLTRYKEYLLVGTFSQGVMVYNKNNQLIDQIESWSEIPNESILSIYIHDDNIYVSSLSGVVEMQLKNNKIKTTQSLNSIIGQTYIYDILAIGDNMFFGTDRNGLVKWNISSDKIEKIKRFDDGEKIGSVYSITADEDSKIWFTSAEKGIGRIIENGIEYLGQIGNLNDEFTSITNLHDGSLLLIRSSSLGLLQPENNHFMYFDKELGLKEERAFLNTTTQDEFNTYFVNSSSIYKYSSLDNIKIHPEVIIDEIIVNLSAVEGINTFDEDENNIAIKYKGSWLTDPSKLSYQYKLEGFEENWRETLDDQIAFPKLTPGQYNFRVRAAENGIFSDEPEATFSFRIKRHFYNYWYVRLLIAAILIALIFRWWRISENRKKEKLALEKTIVDNQLINLKNQLNPHFLFNSFNTLVALIEEDNDRSIAFVEKMTAFYRNMLELGKDGMVNLVKEKEMLDQYVGILKERFNNQLDFKVAYQDPENYEIPPMTLQLLVENAVKHNVVSSKKPLEIVITHKEDNLTVWNKRNQLLNNSKGTHTGLSNIQKRFELANLEIPVVNSTKDFFEVKLKLRKI